MAIKTFTLNLTVITPLWSPLVAHRIEAWDLDPGKADDFLGEAITDELGQCHIRFGLDRASDRGEKRPDIYFKVYVEEELIYNSREAVIYWGLNVPELDVVLRVPVSSEYPIPNIPIRPQQFSINLCDLSNLNEKERAYINRKLDTYFRERILSILGIQGAEIKAVIDALSLKVEDYKDVLVSSLINETLLPALQENPRTAPLLEEFPTEGIRKDGVFVKDILQLDQSIKNHPAFSADIRQITTHVLVDMAVHDKELATQLSESLVRWEVALESDWQELIESGTITEDQKIKLQHGFDLGNMTGNNFGLVRHLLQDERVTHTKDLVSWEAEDWATLIAKNDQETPNGETLEEYIRNLLQVVELSYPSDYFMIRVSKKSAVPVNGHLKDLASLIDNNKDIFTSKNINWEGIEEEEKKVLEVKLHDLQQLADTYQYLGIREIFNGEKSPKQKENALNKAIKSLDSFYQNNPEMGLIHSNFIKNPDGEETHLNWEGISKDMRPKVQRQMLAFQRVRSMAPDYETASILLRNNYDSAYKIAYRGRQGFARDTELREEEASQLFAKAQRKAARATQHFQALVELHHNQHLGLAVDNTISHLPTGFETQRGSGSNHKEGEDLSLYEQVRNELQDISGFQDIFGPQNFCQCDHCKSIFSPAAYFVDLMHFVETEITQYSGSVAASHHTLWLHNRRPDLWGIELTCQCTYEMIPYLQIINEVKEAYIKKLWVNEGRFTAQEVVGMDIYEEFSENDDLHTTFYSPVSKVYRELAILLRHFGVSLHDISKANRQLPAVQWLTYMEVLAPELQASVFPFKRFGDQTEFDQIGVPEFLKHAKISRRELDDILATNYMRSRGDIQLIKTAFDPGIQYSQEKLINIEGNSLRFLRFFIIHWKKVPWTIQELDLVCDTLVPEGASFPSSSSLIRIIVHIRQIQDHLDASIEEVIGILHRIPDKSLTTIERKDPLTQELYKEDVPGYLSRHFDLEKVFEGGSTIAIDPNTNSEAFAYFLSGLKIKPEDFIEMASWGIADIGVPIELDRNNLSVLSTFFRHIQLAKGLRLSLQEWHQVLLLTQNPLDSIENVLELIEWVTTTKNSPLSYEDRLKLLQPEDHPILEDSGLLVPALHNSNVPHFSRSIFRAIVDSDPHVDNLINALIAAAVIEEVEDDHYQLTTKFDWEQLDLAISGLRWGGFSAELKEALTPYHYFKHLAGVYLTHEELELQSAVGREISLNLLDKLVEENMAVVTPDRSFFRVSEEYDTPILENILNQWLPEPTDLELLPQEEQDSLLAAFISIEKAFDAIDALLQEGKNRISLQYHTLLIDLTGYSAERAQALLPFLGEEWRSDLYNRFGQANDTDFPIPAGFHEFAAKVAQLQLLVERLDLNAVALNFISQHAEVVFDINNIHLPQLLTPDSIQALEDYHTWYAFDAAVQENILHPMLLEIRTDENKTATLIAFSHYFDMPESVTGDVFPNYDGSFSSFALLNHPQFAEYLKDRALFCRRLGITNDQLKNFHNYTLGPIKQFTEIIRASFRGQYVKAADFEAAYEPYQKDINEFRRDILCDYILARSEVNFDDANELYAYFLLDPQMSGCMKISKIVAAHLSLQLYTHRVLMNLEKSQDGTFQAFLNPDVHQEWEWRKNYRVWEANRKVAVYPENFIEPEWRDNKSPEFKQLEEELLQEKITLESAEGAYKEYLKKFSDLGRLVIAGVHYDSRDGVFNIFGRSNVAPYQYYIRKFNPTIISWTPWEKIELAISSPYLTSISQNGKLYIFWMDIITTKESSIINGSSVFQWHKSDLYLNYSVQLENGKWLQSQRLFYRDWRSYLRPSDGNQNVYQEYIESTKYHKRVFPFLRDGRIYLNYMFDYYYNGNRYQSNGQMQIDFYKNRINSTSVNEIIDDSFVLAIAHQQNGSKMLEIVQGNNSHEVSVDVQINEEVIGAYMPTVSLPFYQNEVNASMDVVHSGIHSSVLTFDQQQFLVLPGLLERGFWEGILPAAPNIILHRLSTSVIDRLGERLFNYGLELFLKIDQQTYIEKEWPGGFFNAPSYLSPFPEPTTHLDFTGAHGLYFRELFFHIPFLIADHLNAEGKYKEADGWYRKIFDPTAAEDAYMTSPVDRNWQYIEFRDQGMPKYSEMLTNPAFIEVYRKDPFNPHAIARLRISAYQKAIILKYVDNLLDWADSLFRQFQFETINEAMMLYILAQDILGDRPQELCKCDTAADDKLTYKDIQDELGEGNEFLIWLENQQQILTESFPDPLSGDGDPEPGGQTGDNPTYNQRAGNRTASYDTETTKENDHTLEEVHNNGYGYLAREGRNLALKSTSNEKLLFCVPMNKEILGLWDRVEDRLFKIRHCMNIDGVKQTLSLFAPPIDPRLLVAARAAGLSVADAISGLNAAVPNYRFNYMVEKAKSFTGTVQNLGGALLSALEKKDAEELTLLRSVHEQNILKMTQEIKKQQIEENKVQIKNLEETRKNVMNRLQYYTELLDTGLISWERIQQKASHGASIIYGIEGVFGTLAGILSLIPNVGAPTAITYGGIQLSGNMAYAANALNSAAKALNALASSAAIEAGNQRREQEWKQQLTLAEQELKAFDQQIIAAQIRLAIAEKDLEIHKKQIEQAKELYDFYKEKFTNLGLYKYMATSLNRLYSQAYNLAFDMAKQAERCYQFETDDTTFFIENDNWDSGHAGLLAGERLTLQLQRLEKAFIRNSPRREEITQAFSLRMLQPDQLVNLQKNGECSFTIPEWAFDIYYPGHYRRTIKSVRLTIPCVAGPYTNVSCRLNLTQNRMRTQPKSGSEFLFAGPNFANGTISTSTANNDGGQFELNFQDVRYLPFEGGGAAGSEWVLSLPTAFRPFDYGSISDAIIHISYSALYDSTLRSQVETEIQSATDGLLGMDLFRLVSMKEEFPDALYQLEQTPTAEIIINKQHFPYLFSNRIINIEGLDYFDEDANFTPGNLPSPDEGNAPKAWTLEIPQSYLFEEKDVILLIKYKVGVVTGG